MRIISAPCSAIVWSIRTIRSCCASPFSCSITLSRERLYPGALAALRRCGTLGQTVILSDGDVVFRPHKVQRAGLWHAVEERVLIYLHKERMLPASSSTTPPSTTW